MSPVKQEKRNTKNTASYYMNVMLYWFPLIVVYVSCTNGNILGIAKDILPVCLLKFTFTRDIIEEASTGRTTASIS